MKNSKLIVIILILIVLSLFFVFWKKNEIGKVTVSVEDWSVNLCSELNDPSNCNRVSTTKSIYMSDSDLRWWFSYQESIGKDEQFNQSEYDKFLRMSQIIDQHVAKIIAQTNPIGSTELENSNIYIFPRSRISEAEISDAINKNSKWDSVIYDGEYSNVHYDAMIQDKNPHSGIVIGAHIVAPAIKDEYCSQRITYNFLVDMIQRKIIYLDREREFNAQMCKEIR